MHPNCITPPRIEDYDRDIPLIEQIDGFYWNPFEKQTRHAFNLSGWHITFCGNLIDFYIGAGPSYANYQTDITTDTSYRRYVGEAPDQRELWNETTPELELDLAHVSFDSHIYVGERHFALVGGTFLSVKITRVRRALFDNLGDLRGASNLKSYLVQSQERTLIKNPSDEKKYIFPRTPEDIKIETINNRQWGVGDYTYIGNHTRYIYVTALDDSHLLQVYFDPSYWPLEYNNYSEKAKALALEPLYDFMEHCHIEYGEDQDFAIGKFEPEKEDKPDDEDNDPYAW